MLNDTLYKGQRLLSTMLAVIIAFFAFCATFPQHVPTLANMVSDLSHAQFVNINAGNLTVNINNSFELPSLELPQIDFDPNAIVMPTFSVSILLILGAALLIILSSISPVISVITTAIFCVVEFKVAMQTIDVYKAMVAQGSTTWQAAGACFGTVFLILLIVAANGLLGFCGNISKAVFDNFLGAVICSLITAVIGGGLLSVAVAGITTLILGFGWAGIIILMFILVALFSILFDILNAKYMS